VLAQVADHGVRQRTAEWIATEGAAMIVFLDTGVHRFIHCKCRKRKTASNAFRHRQEVGLDWSRAVFEREEFAGAAEAGLDFIDNQHSAVLPAQRLYLTQPFQGGNTHTAFTLHRFNDNSGCLMIQHCGQRSRIGMWHEADVGQLRQVTAGVVGAARH